MKGGVRRGAGRHCAQRTCCARAGKGSVLAGALNAPCTHGLHQRDKFSSVSWLRGMMEVARTVEVELRDQWPRSLDQSGSAAACGAPAGERGGSAMGA